MVKTVTQEDLKRQYIRKVTFKVIKAILKRSKEKAKVREIVRKGKDHSPK